MRSMVEGPALNKRGHSTPSAALRAMSGYRIAPGNPQSCRGAGSTRSSFPVTGRINA